MKNYTVGSVLSDVSHAVQVNGKVVIVDKLVGINTWGKLDFLKRHGYTVVSRVESK